jgi:hypothetical protein
MDPIEAVVGNDDYIDETSIQRFMYYHIVL